MNCFGKYTESTESLIPHEEEDENVAVIREDMREVLIEDEIVEIKDDDQTGEDEVGEEMEEEEKSLTDEELRAIAQEVEKREGESIKKLEESPDFIAKLLEHCINTILLEEMTGVGRKMNAFRQAMAAGVMKFAEREEAENSTAKMDRFVDSFRATWKDWKEKQDAESMVNVFMREMDNELWYPDR